MATTHFSGPVVSFGVGNGPGDNNTDIGTSLFYGGSGLIDQRGYWYYNPGSTVYRGWLGTSGIFTVDYVPSALATGNIAATQAPTTAVALSLITAAASGITPLASVQNAATGSFTSANLLVIDALTAAATGTISGNVFTAVSGASGTFTVGTVLSGTGVTSNTTIIGLGTGKGGTGTYIVDTPQTVTSTTISGNAGIHGVPIIPSNTNMLGPQLYNPLGMVGRNVRITTRSSDVAVYTVAGYDVYGYPMTEAITAAGAGTVSGLKAFKYISSVTPVGTVGAGVSVGTGDVFGFPLFSLTSTDVLINWNANNVTATTGYLAGDTTTPATTTTGDVRGTYAVQSASDASKRLTIRQSPPPTTITSVSGLFGVTQV